MSHYYAVIFSTVREIEKQEGYQEMSEKMLRLAQAQPGFIEIESVRGPDGRGMSVSYWRTLEDIRSWKQQNEHLMAQQMGKSRWYRSYKVRICKVEREYEFSAEL